MSEIVDNEEIWRLTFFGGDLYPVMSEMVGKKSIKEVGWVMTVWGLTAWGQRIIPGTLIAPSRGSMPFPPKNKKDISYVFCFDSQFCLSKFQKLHSSMVT